MRADFDFGDERHGRPWDRVLGVLRIVAEAVLFVGAIAILYLAFRGPSSHPSASAVPAASSPRSSHTAVAQGTGQGNGVRPATMPSEPSATPAVTALPASPGTGAGRAADSLSTQVQGYLAGRRGSVEAAIYDLSTGQQWTMGRQAPQPAASVVDLEILETVLNQQTTRRKVLSLAEQELSPPMIEQSDDDAATTLWADVGGAKGMRAFDHKVGLAHTSPSSSAGQRPGFSGPDWALTSTTPQDQVTLLRQLARPSRLLDKNDQKYALYLLENVASSQRWGVSGGVPAGVTVALKNGALPLNPGNSDWQVNSVGWVSGGGRNYLMSVLSTGNPSEEYGIDTLNHLGAMVWSAVASHR